QEGTYPLPEAQVDRFMLKIVVDYPNKEQELRIVERMAKTGQKAKVSSIASPEQIFRARELMDEIYVDQKILHYLVDLAFATRRPTEAGLDDLAPLILYGISPRGTIALTQAARARAFLEGRGFVTPHDVKSVAMPVLQHRLITTYEAEAEGIDSAQVIRRVLDAVPVP
ncbi:MAG: MoxR family ATPase, partial [Planctomycetota bacterium]